MTYTLESIEKYAFGSCTSLETIVIPKSVTSIAKTAFKGDDITIYCYKDSYALDYAIQYGIDYVVIDEKEYEIGDVNRDGKMDITDATLIQRYLAELDEIDDEQLRLADVNQDEEVNILDATEIQTILTLA